MDLVARTQRHHSKHGVVTIERIYKEYASVEVSDSGVEGHVPSDVLIDFEDEGGEVRTEDVREFADNLS